MTSIFRELQNENLKFNGSEIPVITVNQEKLDIDIKTFSDNDIILIRSGTATSKTKLIAKLCPQIVGENDKLLSIVNLINLSREQISTFQKESGTSLLDYQSSTEMFNENNAVICINSLLKLQNNKEEYELQNKILFIDEINDLIETLTHNNSLDTIINKTYNYLIKLVKNCKKIILSDATVNQNTINFLSTIDNTNKKITLINNVHEKFENINAIQYKNKLEFIEKLRTHIKDKKYFLFACDIRSEVSSIYSNLRVEFSDQADDFILITSEEEFKLIDASKQFKNKYVFYSPSITTGVSYINTDEKQTQFLYISNKRFITPEALYQMSCRTRNMNELIYHCENMNDIKSEFETIKELENKYKNLMKINEKLLNLSKSTNENDEVKIVSNTFFKLWCYNEFKRHIFKTGFIQHYKTILSNAGFIHSEVGEYVKLSRQEKTKMKSIYTKYTDSQFCNFLEFRYSEETEKLLEQKKNSQEYKDLMTKKEKIEKMSEDEFLEYMRLENWKYRILDKRHDILGLKTRIEAEDNKIFLQDEYALQNYFNVLGLFKTKEYLKQKLETKIEESFRIKTYDNVYNKILLISKFEKHYKISRFDFNFDNVDITNEFSEKQQQLYVNLFDSKKTNFKNKHQLLLIYLNMIRNIAGGNGGIPIILRKEKKIKIDTGENPTIKKKEKKIKIDTDGNPIIPKKAKKINEWKKTYTYAPNEDILTHIINVAKNKNPTLKNYDLEFIKKITGIEPSEKHDNNLFKDEEDEYIAYLFNKTNKKTIFND